MILLVAGEEIEEQAGLAEATTWCRCSRAEDVAEQLLGLAPVEEMRLVGRALIGVARRDGDAVDADRHDLVEEARDALGLGAVERACS